MEIYQLKTFAAVAQQGHLTQAAEILHLSQPAVTAQIKALEEEMGVSLFERCPGGVQLTEAGKELLVDAEQVLQTAKGILAHAKSLQGKLTGKAKIGVIVNPADLKLGTWLLHFIEKYPLVSIVTTYGISGHVLNAVRKKELAAGFYLGNNPYQNVHSVKLRTMSYAVAIPKTWDECIAHNDWQALSKIPWLGISQFCATSEISQAFWRKHNIMPKKIGEFDGEQVLLELVCAGVGASLLPLETARSAEAKGLLNIWRAHGKEVASEVDLHFVYPRDNAQDPIIVALLATILRVWKIEGCN